ncbi:NADH-ubiquinone oxidoreductase-F iron-sulfur binding region domain-containing protein [Gordonia sp. NPDC003504]
MTASTSIPSALTPTPTPIAPVPGRTPLGTGRLLAGTRDGRVGFDAHLARSGYPRHRDLAWLCDASRRVGLRGRGGAGFPVAEKLAAIRPGRSVQVLVNGSESDPTSWKDRTLMRQAPHRVIDGALIAAAALNTDSITVVTHDEPSTDSLWQACAERADAGSVDIRVVGGGFVAGESHAVIAGLNGAHPTPPGRHVSATRRGIGGAPTFAANVETVAQLGLLAELGVERFAELGSCGEWGTVLLTLSGAVASPGVVEVATNTPLSALLGGRAPGSRSPRPVLLGGYHGRWIGDETTRLDHDSLAARGLDRGVGSITVLPPHTCALGEIARVAHWLADRSAGQCGPCVFGLRALADDFSAFYYGEPRDLDAIRRRLGLVAGRGSCHHPDGAVGFLGSALGMLGAEIDRHRRGGCGRDVLGILPVPDTDDHEDGADHGR